MTFPLTFNSALAVFIFFAVFTGLYVGLVRFPRWFVCDILQTVRWRVRDDVYDRWGASRKADAIQIVEVADRAARNNTKVTAHSSSNETMNLYYRKLKAVDEFEGMYGNWFAIIKSCFTPRHTFRKTRESRVTLNLKAPQDAI